MIRIFLQDAETHMEGGIYGTRTRFSYQILFKIISWILYLGLISLHMEIAVFVGKG